MNLEIKLAAGSIKCVVYQHNEGREGRVSE
jgi:hypothetical protein